MSIASENTVCDLTPWRDTVARLNSGAVWDAMTYDLGHRRPFVFDRGIRLHSGSRIFGPAFTVHGRYNPNRTASEPEAAVIVRMLRSIPEGAVEVLQTNHDGPVGSFGGFTMALMRAHGCVAAVTDGFTRDLEQLREAEYPLACRGSVATNGFGSGWQLAGWDEPVRIRGYWGGEVHVHPGDFVFADADAAMAVPRQIVRSMLEHATRRLENESRLLERIRAGSLALDELEKNIRERRFDF